MVWAGFFQGAGTPGPRGQVWNQLFRHRRRTQHCESKLQIGGEKTFLQSESGREMECSTIESKKLQIRSTSRIDSQRAREWGTTTQYQHVKVAATRGVSDLYGSILQADGRT